MSGCPSASDLPHASLTRWGDFGCRPFLYFKVLKRNGASFSERQCGREPVLLVQVVTRTDALVSVRHPQREP